jgi:hypothetical protein
MRAIECYGPDWTGEKFQVGGIQYSTTRKINFKGKYYFLMANRGDTGCAMVADEIGNLFEIKDFFNNRRHTDYMKLENVSPERFFWYMSTFDCAMTRYAKIK